MGELFGLASVSPRLASISSSSVTVTAMPANASFKEPSNVSIDLTLLLRPDGSETTGSPLRMTPDAIVPQKPR